ncbi:MAG TPA: hypothetical protein VJG48_02270 [Candidatus Paceibacterota bacterium]
MSSTAVLEPRQTTGISPTQASGMTKVNYNNILYWIRTRLARASIRYEGKQYRHVLMTFADVLEIAVIAILRDKGAPTRRIKRALHVLRRLRTTALPLKGHYLDVTGEPLILRDVRVQDVVAGQGHVLLINLGRLEEELRERARKQHVALPSNREEE